MDKSVPVTESTFALTLPSSYTRLIVRDSVLRGIRNPSTGRVLTLRECCHSILCSYVEEFLLDDSHSTVCGLDQVKEEVLCDGKEHI